MQSGRFDNARSSTATPARQTYWNCREEHTAHRVGSYRTMLDDSSRAIPTGHGPSAEIG